MRFKKLILEYLIGELPTEDIPKIGISGLEEGYESSSLCILAGIEKNENVFEMEKYLKYALNELAFDIPEERNAYISYAFILSDEVITERKNVVDGVSEIVSKVLFKYDFYSETKNHVYDSLFFENVYGLYDTYNDLLDAQYAGAEWVKDKSNSELLVEMEAELLNALKEWNKKIREYIKFV